jgi:putative spermidine/putrescine transport system permease protein
MSARDPMQPSRWTLGANWLVLALLILPMTVVLPVSLTDRTYLSLPEHGVSLQHYARLFSSSEWLASFGQSAVIGIVSTLLAVVVGALATIGCWQLGTGLATPIRVLLLLPLIVPSVVYALGIYRLFMNLDLLDTYLGVILAHAVTGIPYVVITTSASLTSFDPALLRAARGLGATRLQALRRILLPNITPGIASGAILAFIHSWDEIVVVLFVASRSITTVPRRIWDGINDQLDPIIAAVATVMVLVSMLLFALKQMASRDRATN